MKEHYKQKKWLIKLKTILALGLLLFATSAMAQLNGTYTIDSGAVTSGTNYQSFVDFADTINKYGVSGPVTVNVVSNSGPYNQWVEFKDIVGSSSTNTITLNGNGNTVSHAGSTSRSPVFAFSSTDYFTLDNLVIENTGSDYGRCVQIYDVSTYVTISNCKLNMPNMTSKDSPNAYVVLGEGDSYWLFSTANAAEHCTITKNTTSGPINGGPYYAVFLSDSYGNTDNKFNTIHDNELKDFLSTGIRTQFCDEGTKITNNTIHNTGHTNDGISTFGIDIYQHSSVGGFNISNNKIYNLRNSGKGTECYGIRYQSQRVTSSSKALIANNIIEMKPLLISYGIYTNCQYDAGGLDILHNTILLTKGTYYNNSSNHLLYLTYQSGNVKNNLLYSNINNSRNLYGVHNTNGPTYDNNNINFDEVTGVGYLCLGHSNGVSSIDFNGMNFILGNTWMNKPMSFVDAGNHDFRGNSLDLANKGIPVGVTTDINGKTRSTTSPDLGAVEYDIDFSSSSINFITNPIECGNFSKAVGISYKNEGSFPVLNIPLAYSINGSIIVIDTIAGPIAAGATVNHTFSEIPTFNTPGTNELRVFINGDDDVTNDTSDYSFEIKSTSTGGTLSQGSTFEGHYNTGTDLDPDIIATLYTNSYDISRPTIYSSTAPGSDYSYTLTATDQDGIDVTGAGFSYTALAESFSFMPEDSLDGRSIIVDIKVTDANTGCDTSIIRSLYVPHTPKPSFESKDICLGDITQFQNMSTLMGSSSIGTRWKFNDPDVAVTNDTAITTNGLWEYTTHGKDIMVEMTVYNNNYPKFSYTSSNTIDVTPRPNVDFKILNACEGSPINVENNSTSALSDPLNYEWDFGGKYSSTDEEPSYTFSTSGQYKVKLTATVNGCFDTLTKVAYQFEVPMAEFTSVGECSFVDIDFTNSSTIENNARMSYVWDFDGEGTSRDENPSFAFTTPGTKAVKLTATSDFGCDNQITKNIVLKETPEATFDWDNACNLTPINFNITGSLPNEGANCSYEWDFAGESTSQQADPSHLFSEVGTKTVKLSISDLNGCSSSSEKEVNVLLQPIADFEVGSSICEGDEVSFTNKSSVASGDLTYEWTFDDGNTSTDLSPKHTYTEAKRYDVKLKASVEGGCIHEVSHPIVIDPLPDATFTLDKKGRTIEFDGPEGNDVYRWTFGDGSNDDSEDPTYTYEDAVDQGTFTVCLATKKGECWNDECEDVTIDLVGIKNLAQDNDMINLYPNPTTGKFNVTVENAGDIVVKVGDILGNVLDINVTDNLNGTFSIDLSVVADGVYFVQVKNGDYFATKRITVSK